MDPIKQGKEHLNNSAQKMLNLSIDLIKNPKVKGSDFVEGCLTDAIQSVGYAQSGGDAPTRIDSMSKQFSNTLRLMKKNGVEINKDTMISVFRNSLDEKAASTLNESLTPENKTLVENALEACDAKSDNRKSFENGGLSM